MENVPGQKILTIDIGGSHIKAVILNAQGELISDYKRVPTPVPAAPEAVLKAIKGMVTEFNFDKVSVGFPGYVKNGVVETAPNLGSELWKHHNLAQVLSDSLHKPAKVVNDADLQGLGLAKGKGLELVITLGTGFGTAMINDGVLLPHLELAHHPVTKNQTYDEYIGQKALDKIGKKRWNKRMKNVIGILITVFHYDFLSISGGNADKLTFKLDSNISIDSNKDGIKGGTKLWSS
jgi:polyphosphate glucokinase